MIASADRSRLFEIEEFLSARGWLLSERQGTREWHGSYSRNGKGLSVNSTAGTGDIVTQLGNRRVVAEFKGGPLVKKHGSHEYRILKEALGQALLWNGDASDLVIVAVPDTQWFRSIAESWRQRPLVRRVGIQIALASESGNVWGVDPQVSARVK